jgi:hypothetical protein
MPGAPHPYLQQQRSQSSASTPTSAHSQPPYFNQQLQDSPVSASHFPPSQISQHQRQQSQQSQPGTPLGPPVNQRHSYGGFTQPSSPYQQRGLSSGPFSQFQTSPAPPAASIPKLPSTPGGYDSQRTSTSEQHRTSQSERERSISVSPKTRIPSQTRGDITIASQQSENDHGNSVKRKMEGRETPIEQHQQIERDEMKPQTNGDHRTPSGTNSSPQQPPKKRTRYTEPPIWARSVLGRTKGSYGSIKVNQKANGNRPVVNIPAPAPPPPAAPPPVAPPPAAVEINGHGHIPPPVAPIDDPSRILGPWEKSITGKKPFEHMTKIVADWLYLNVVSRNDIGELASRGVEIEIEAKLGQLINKDTNERYYLPVLSECVLAENARVGFRSSMTEV